uniref:AMP-binding protein n=1 Tax=Pararhizobium sp. IMCC3301 TaxID=3067904 RepID=UPI0027414574|nr:AMP-binding protein [Pararhizobium sp. IMCC3301]
MLDYAASYDALYRNFCWRIPARFNIAEACCETWRRREPNRVALHHILADGDVQNWTFSQLSIASNKLANYFCSSGCAPGERIGILLPQAPETLISHLATYKAGLIAVPLALLFGPDALAYRLKDGGVSCVITNAQGLEKLLALQSQLPDLRSIIVADMAPQVPLPDHVHHFDEIQQKASATFQMCRTGPDDPAMMIYTSGTTGAPKGALHGHRVVLGHLPGMQMSHNFLPQPGDRIWTPADWAWAGGLLNVLLPSLLLGVAVVSSAVQKFDPEWAFDLMQTRGVVNAFIPPTALKMLRAVPHPAERFALHLRTLASAGEALGAETYHWVQHSLSLTVNDAYGQTECNLVLGSCSALGISRAGAIGRIVPGHQLAILDEDGSVVPPGTQGEIAIRAPDPVMMLSYWNKPAETAAKFKGPDKDWFTTGDQAVMDEEGFVSFVGRDDDIITSAGYRIGPTEVEDTLLSHPSVVLAAAIGKPDPLRTEIVKAYVVLADGYEPSAELAGNIQDYVRNRLSAHAYPREIAFRSALPLTTSGKIIRRTLRQEAICEAAAAKPLPPV